jgi:hypothetical protein
MNDRNLGQPIGGDLRNATPTRTLDAQLPYRLSLSVRLQGPHRGVNRVA